MSPDSKGNDILRRIVQATGAQGLLDALVSKISIIDLQSLLLHVYKMRTSSLSAADVLKQYRNNRFVKISNVSPPEILQFDSMAFSMLPEGFQPVELSPVSPLGASSVLGPVSFPHFRMLSLCTSGRDPGSHGFEAKAVIEHTRAEKSPPGCDLRNGNRNGGIRRILPQSAFQCLRDESSGRGILSHRRRTDRLDAEAAEQSEGTLHDERHGNGTLFSLFPAASAQRQSLTVNFNARPSGLAWQ
jgi:hypothetical protein